MKLSTYSGLYSYNLFSEKNTYCGQCNTTINVGRALDTFISMIETSKIKKKRTDI